MTGRPGGRVIGPADARGRLRGLSLVELFTVYVDKGLIHTLKVFIALLEEAGRCIGRIEVSPVPIAEQRLQRQLIFALALHDHPVQTCDLVVGQVIEYPAAQQLPGKIDQ